MKTLKKSLYIDALALVPEKKSGIGVTLERTLEQLLKMPAISSWQVYLVVPLGKAKYLTKYIPLGAQIRTIYLPARVLTVLSRMKLLPPMDLFLGRGVYLFPNYRNWPVWRSRSLTYIYDVAYLKYPETVQAKNQRYLSRSMPSWVRRTDRVITISNQVKYEIEKYLSLSELQISIVPCGVDTSVFYRRSRREVERVKKQYGIASEKYFLFVGNIEPRKNLERLLEAYERLPKTIQDEYALVIVGGGGWNNETILQRIREMQSGNLKVIKVSSYVTNADLPAIYSGASMLIHPAIYEGFGITPLEAMACGIPLAVSDLPAIREVVGDGTGQYFDPLDTRSIIGAIQTVLAGNSGKSATDTKQEVVLAKNFSWKHSAEKLFDILGYEQGLGVRHHPFLTRCKYAYQVMDRKLLHLLGERSYPPYVPQPAKTKHELKMNILDDFYEEQPASVQVILKKAYLGLKHLLATVLKKAYRFTRRALTDSSNHVT